MSSLLEWLEDLNSRDKKVRAVLRRSLAFDPGTYVPSYPYVERFTTKGPGSWERSVAYLIAGLWASNWREGPGSSRLSLATAALRHWDSTGKSPSVEQRFMNLLDADQDQLPYRLRQMVKLLNDQSIDFHALQKDLSYWSDVQRRVQGRWAREFYRTDAGQSDSTSTDGDHK